MIDAMNDPENAVWLVDKPIGMTSFGVIKKLRYITGIRKMGHAGTLDPLATGLLIICTGKKTKQIDQYQGQEKEYVSEIQFGGTTPSYDSEFPPENRKDCSHLTAAMIEAEMQHFMGEIDQMPPVFSALKIEGKPAYKLARKGKPVELKSRKVTVRQFSLDSFNPPDLIKSTIICSKGTYIRSLAHDLGQRLGTGAWLHSLRRTAIGNFRVENAMNFADFQVLFPSKKTIIIE
jgi:tRNA pseudouridine55 synthase